MPTDEQIKSLNDALAELDVNIDSDRPNDAQFAVLVNTVNQLRVLRGLMPITIGDVPPVPVVDAGSVVATATPAEVETPTTPVIIETVPADVPPGVTGAGVIDQGVPIPPDTAVPGDAPTVIVSTDVPVATLPSATPTTVPVPVETLADDLATVNQKLLDNGSSLVQLLATTAKNVLGINI